jgi:hypothetical protein
MHIFLSTKSIFFMIASIKPIAYIALIISYNQIYRNVIKNAFPLFFINILSKFFDEI